MDLFANPFEREPVSPFLRLLWERGTAREKEVIAALKEPILDLSASQSEEKERLTLAAMDNGKALIYGGRISCDDLVGEPDLLRKQENGYVAGDIKSGAGEEGANEEHDGTPKLHYAVQLALYTDILERLGRSHGRTPFVWDIRGSEVPYDLMETRGKRNPHRLWDDYQDCLAQVRNIVNGVSKTLPAYSTGVCKNCVWYTSCLEKLEAANDLTLIPELGRSKRDVMFARIPSIRDLALINQAEFIDEGKTVFSGIGTATLAKMQERAKLLMKDDGKPYLTGPVKLPEVQTELFFDIEVDPWRDGFCYLHGFVERQNGRNETERFVYFFANALSSDEERRAFSEAWAYIQSSQPSALYFYSKYERTVYRSLADRYPEVCTRNQVDELFECERSIDLYNDVVKKKTEWPTRDYSIKTLAQYLGFKWKDTHPSGAASIEWFYRWSETRDPGNPQTHSGVQRR
jgi:predicted RecB family nuclease